MSTKQFQCPLCDSRDVRPFAARTELIECLSCRLVSVKERPSEAEIIQIYRAASELDDNINPFPSIREASENKLLCKWLRTLLKGKPKPRLIEFGCGHGAFLEEAQNWGFDCIGVEIYPPRVRYAVEQRKLKVLSYEEFVAQAPESFDAAVSFQAFEHLSDPLGVMCNLARLLVPGGVAILQVPDKDVFVYDSGHMSYFGTEQISLLAKKGGFEVLAVNAGRTGRSTLSRCGIILPLCVVSCLDRIALFAGMRGGAITLVARKPLK